MQRLINIQQELKVPKSQRNTFGNYNYRSCEDILEEVKPLLKKQGLALIISDEILEISGRFYVKATAKLIDTNKDILATTSAFAREEETKKGQDGSQITGASSSYARKYALNGLFGIDDAKDSDTTNTHQKEEKPKEKPKLPQSLDEYKKDMEIISTIDDLKAYGSGIKQLINSNKELNKIYWDRYEVLNAAESEASKVY